MLEDQFIRALRVGYVATVAALCGRSEEALSTPDRLAVQPVSFLHLGKLRYGPEWNNLRSHARFQELTTDAEATLRTQTGKYARTRVPILESLNPFAGIFQGS